MNSTVVQSLALPAPPDFQLKVLQWWLQGPPDASRSHADIIQPAFFESPQLASICAALEAYVTQHRTVPDVPTLETYWFARDGAGRDRALYQHIFERLREPLPDGDGEFVRATIVQWADRQGTAHICREALKQGAGVDELRRMLTTASDLRPASHWDKAQTVDTFLETPADAADLWLHYPLLARGSVAEWFAPKGDGKTLILHALLIRVAKAGFRVLLIDRDNPPADLRRRLRAWQAAGVKTLDVLTRNDAPPLTDAAAWAAFPVGEYDVVALDALDSATEGVGEKDSARPSKALAPLLDLARRENGPAVIVMANTVKSGEFGRGSGVIQDRADICFEVRDATDFTPSGPAWIKDLPPSGAGAWRDRSLRRVRKERYWLAFAQTKFRLDAEPPPFILEADLSADWWQLRDVTSRVVAEGQAALDRAAKERAEALDTAAEALRVEIAARAALLKDKDAVPFLMARGLSQRAARGLIAERDGILWRAEVREHERGKPTWLRPLPVSKNPRRRKSPPAETRSQSGAERGGFPSPASTAVTEILSLQTSQRKRRKTGGVSVTNVYAGGGNAVSVDPPPERLRKDGDYFRQPFLYKGKRPGDGNGDLQADTWHLREFDGPETEVVLHDSMGSLLRAAKVAHYLARADVAARARN